MATPALKRFQSVKEGTETTVKTEEIRKIRRHFSECHRPTDYTGGLIKDTSSTNVIRKILLTGDGTVGKSSFMRRYVTGEYSQRYHMTLAGRTLFYIYRGGMGKMVHDHKRVKKG